MHIFLTGKINIGKTTIIRNVTDYLQKYYNINIKGLETYKDLYNDTIYLSPWNNKKLIYKIGYIKNEKVKALTEVFETIGVKILKNTYDAQLIIIDELGFLENKANNFQKTILNLLNKRTPILGVIKEKKIEWLEKIKLHPKVRVVTVTKENRNQLIHSIRNDIINLINKKSCYFKQ